MNGFWATLNGFLSSMNDKYWQFLRASQYLRASTNALQKCQKLARLNWYTSMNGFEVSFHALKVSVFGEYQLVLR